MTDHSPSSVSEATPKILLSVEAAAAALGIHRATMYDLLASGRVASVKIGRRRLVPHRALEAFVNSHQEHSL